MDGGNEFYERIKLSGEPRMTGIYVGEPQDEITVSECMKLNAKRYEYTGRYYERWNESAKLTLSGRPLDAILSPVLPFAGEPHEGFGCISYTGHWNLVDFPAITVPVGKVEAQGKDADAPFDYLGGRKPESELEACNEALWKERNGVAGFDGFPLTLQLIGRRYQEEHLMGVAKAVRSALSG